MYIEKEINDIKKRLDKLEGRRGKKSVGCKVGYSVFVAEQEIRQFLEKKYTVELGGKKLMFVWIGEFICLADNGLRVLHLSTEVQQEIFQRADIPVMSHEEYLLWKAGE